MAKYLITYKEYDTTEGTLGKTSRKIEEVECTGMDITQNGHFVFFNTIDTGPVIVNGFQPFESRMILSISADTVLRVEELCG